MLLIAIFLQFVVVVLNNSNCVGFVIVAVVDVAVTGTEVTTTAIAGTF